MLYNPANVQNAGRKTGGTFRISLIKIQEVLSQ